MSKWVIVKLVPGSIQMLSKEPGLFTTNPEDVRTFDTEADAILMAATIRDSTLVQELTVHGRGQPKIQFPKPDFFESSPDLMKLETLVELLKSDDLLEYFTPTNVITGAKQMTGGGISDPLTGRIIGRVYQFSFHQCLGDADVNELYELARQVDGWDNVEYQRNRLGFTEYAILTLKVKIV